ncbi:hypothetical protein CBR_g4515 [Chara braunii]|uniref:Uncharacterized protein n=1 Tax=Chara braunii TaxID=69332 RepID=A0A388KI06_CHABU|nr:hypothetical protein CBR_g4515 [Chara braunii]|eukprot:GBG69685.1 hypothetical protein CBR_g4515 [Chara braunii]
MEVSLFGSSGGSGCGAKWHHCSGELAELLISRTTSSIIHHSTQRVPRLFDVGMRALAEGKRGAEDKPPLDREERSAGGKEK